MLINKQRIPSPHPDIRLFLLTYLSDGLRVKGYLAEPAWSQSLPGLVYLRGGIKNVGMVRVQRIIQWASEGFVVLAPFYRGNKGGEGNEDFAGKDREDGISAVDLLKTIPTFDSEQGIHLIGFSRGGVMAFWAAIAREEVATVTSWNGVTDMFLTYEERVDLRRMLKRVIGGTPNKVPESYDWRTPLSKLPTLNASVLLIHGVLDEHVSIEHAYAVEKVLRASELPVESWYFNNFHHQFPIKEQQKVLHNAAEWMKSQVKGY
ncbi:alpha/beta hydrolase family protein [Alkalicoccobacillus porphyridii]|uniref:S9 family peptidase n=1 Tax=Alkalicoccobacillus porphyridii TaxID=2597270 RepID=A0A554A3B2_9BACI|nr:prolyl oligopeptidase family serine peptidase [Alkalicoccobacillus porphyridii]TSB48136.1 S9 family peptidase [Alkalicoccobacillus porphyridii]